MLITGAKGSSVAGFSGALSISPCSLNFHLPYVNPIMAWCLIGSYCLNGQEASCRPECDQSSNFLL